MFIDGSLPACDVSVFQLLPASAVGATLVEIQQINIIPVVDYNIAGMQIHMQNSISDQQSNLGNYRCHGVARFGGIRYT